MSSAWRRGGTRVPLLLLHAILLAAVGPQGLSSSPAGTLDREHFREILVVYVGLLNAKVLEALARDDLGRLGIAVQEICATDAPQVAEPRQLLVNRLIELTQAKAAEGTDWPDATHLPVRSVSGRDAEAGAVLYELACEATLGFLQDPPSPEVAYAVARSLGRLAEVRPSPEVMRALERAARNWPHGYERTVLLTWVGRARLRQGRRQEALRCFQAAVAEPNLDIWPDGHMAVRDAFIEWARLEPDVAVEKALAQIGQYEEVWAGPAQLTCVVVAEAAKEIAKSDPPRAIEMVRNAPETEWVLGGTHNTRGMAMIALAGMIASDHPEEGEQLIDEAFGEHRWLDIDESIRVMSLLPVKRSRGLLARHIGYERFVTGGHDDLLYLGPSVVKALVAIDPGLVTRMVARWAEFLPEAPAPSYDRARYNELLTALASAEHGQALLRDPDHHPRYRLWSQIRRLIQWIDVLHTIIQASTVAAP